MRVCLFDIDGTLVNSGDAGQAAMESGLATAFGVSRPAEGISTAGRTDRAIIEDLMDFHGLPGDEATFGQVREAYLAGLPVELARLGVDADRLNLLAHLFEQRWIGRGQGRPAADGESGAAVRAARDLQSRGRAPRVAEGDEAVDDASAEPVREPTREEPDDEQRD